MDGPPRDDGVEAGSASASAASGGTTQYARRLAALEPASVPVDGRTEAELLNWLAGFSELVNYFNQEDRLDGNWGPFFAAQPLVQYARIASLDLADLGDQYRALLGRWQQRDERHLGVPVQADLVVHLYAACRRVEAARRFFAGQPTERDYAAKITAAIDAVFAGSLAVALRSQQRLETETPGIFATLCFDADVRSFDPVPWQLAGGVAGANGRGSDLRALSNALWRAHGAERQLVVEAQQRFAALQASPGDLPPHFAVALNFVRQFGHIQQQINALPERHLDLFYREVLEEAPAPLEPDRVFLAFGTAAASEPFRLPAGTLLAGKTPAGAAVSYALENALDLSGYSLAKVATIRTTGTDDETGFEFRTTSLPPAAPAPRPLFGQPPAGNDSGSNDEVDLGFAIASPYFHLAGGRRVVTLEFTFGSQGEPAGAKGVEESVSSRFRFWYSGAAQWVEVGRTPSSDPPMVSITADGQRSIATLTLTLEPGAPAWMNFDPKKLAGGFSPDWPVLKVQVRSSGTVATGETLEAGGCFLRLLSGRPFKALAIKVDVSELDTLTLYNDLGVVAPGAPILPFGNMPQPGSRFYIGCPELFRKHASTLALDLTWQNLAGLTLSDYYQSYAQFQAGELDPPSALPAPPPGRASGFFEASQYTVACSYLMNGSWQLWPGETPVQPAPTAAGGYALFADGTSTGAAQASTGDAPIAKVTQFAPAQWDLPAPPAYRLAATLLPPAQSQTGYLAIELAEPSHAFGQAMYPQVASAVALYNAQVLLLQAQQGPTQVELVFQGEAENGTATGERSAGSSAPPASSARMEEPPLVTSQEIFDRWKERVARTPWQALTFQPARYRLPRQLFARLKSPHSALPPLPIAWQATSPITLASVVTALQTLEHRAFADRPELDALLSAALGLESASLSPAAPLVLNAIYQLIDQSLRRPAALSSSKPASLLMPMPNPPLAPTLSSVSLAYTAQTGLGGPVARGEAPGEIVQLLPFSTRPLPPAGTAGRTLIERLEAGGYLYLAIKDAVPGESVSLLFVLQPQPGPGPSDAEQAPPRVEWSILTQNGFSSALGGETLKDGTLGLMKTGLVEVTVPRDVHLAGGLMPAGACWLRIFTPQPQRFPRCLQILTQAGTARWAPPAAAHLAQPLPAGTLKTPPTCEPRVKSVSQPLPAFGGRPAETAVQFRVRLSERLRHKGRAWTAWDYERLLLQQFPEIFYARCLPHTRCPTGPGGIDEEAGGHVLVVVLPALASPPATLPPGFVAGDLAQMEAWLRGRASPAVEVRVCNPAYEAVQLSAEVTFQASESPENGRRQLNAELRQYISPWLYQPATTADVAAEFHLAALRTFIQSRPYVKAVKSCAWADDAGSSGLIRARHRWSVLVTAETHLINAPPNS